MGSPIVRIEENDTDLRFRQKANTNFALLAKDHYGLGVPPDVEDAISEAISAAIASDVASMIQEAIAAKIQQGTNVPAALALAPGATVEKTVTFALAFAAVPVVTLTSYSSDVNVSMVSATENGFVYTIKNLGALELTAAPTNWIAVMS